MYTLATTTDAPEGLGEAISAYLLKRGLDKLTRCEGVVRGRMEGHKPERRVASGEHWMLWRDPPFGAEVEPAAEVVACWVEEAELLSRTPKLAVEQGPSPDPSAQRH